MSWPRQRNHIEDESVSLELMLLFPLMGVLTRMSTVKMSAVGYHGDEEWGEEKSVKNRKESSKE